MKIGIVGLGLVGSSIARAMKEFSENEIYAQDKDGIILDAACLGGVVDGVLDDGKSRNVKRFSSPSIREIPLNT